MSRFSTLSENRVCFPPRGEKLWGCALSRSLSRSFFQSGSIVLDLGCIVHISLLKLILWLRQKAAFFRPTSTDPWSWRAGKEIWGLQGTFPIENWLLCLSLSRSPRFPRVTQICFTLHLPFYYSPLSLIPSRLYMPKGVDGMFATIFSYLLIFFKWYLSATPKHEAINSAAVVYHQITTRIQGGTLTGQFWVLNTLWTCQVKERRHVHR